MEFKKGSYRKLFWLVALGVVLLVALQNITAVLKTVAVIIGCCAPVIAGLCVAFVLNVPMRGIEENILWNMKKPGRRRTVALLLTVVLALGVVLLIAVVIWPDLRLTLETLINDLPQLMKDGAAWVETQLARLQMDNVEIPQLQIDWNKTVEQLIETISFGNSDLISTTAGIASSVLGTSFNVLFSIIVAVYTLAQKENIGAFLSRTVCAFLPQRAADKIFHICELAYETFANFIGGQLTDSFILGILCWLGMLIFGFPYAVAVAVIVGIASLVPVVGAIAGGLVGAVLVLSVDPLQSLFFLIFLVILQQIEGNLIYPRVVGKSVGLPRLIVLCAVLVGGNLAGVLGALLSVPLSAVLYVLLRETIAAREEKKQAAADAQLVPQAETDIADAESCGEEKKHDKQDKHEKKEKKKEKTHHKKYDHHR